jgi:hypothetical protein
VPALERVLRGASPLVDAAHVFFPELNPILSYFNFRQTTIAGFFNNAGPDLSAFWGGKDRGQEQVGIIDDGSFQPHFTKPCPSGVPPAACGRPENERGNAYMAPNALTRAQALGIVESFNCDNVPGGKRQDPVDTAGPPGGTPKQPPCFVEPPSLYDNKKFNRILKGKAPKVDGPKDREGRTPAVDPNPSDPAK